MWLIDCVNVTLKAFNNEREIPDYAILSHRWMDGQEVLFKDLIKSRRPDLSGWKKIRLCCSQALMDGIKFCWIDTCCIDKSSSAELSEAINSMYRYYSSAKVCYAYLIDVDRSKEIAMETQFVESSWFTRCWTLQELLAPKVVGFYDTAWRFLGTRLDLCEEVAEASGIQLSVFTSLFDPEEWSLAQRMSWASKRRATRIEDVAYSLLGIFDINIPLLYGEGKKAFTRLQEEIIRRTSDHTIFAWSTYDNKFRPSSTLSYTSLLAASPYAFKDDSNLVAKNFDDTLAYAITNLGLDISLPVVSWAPNLLLVGLNCTRDSQNRVYMFVLEQKDTTHISVRAVYNDRVFVNLRGHLPTSKHLRLTIATQIDALTRNLFDTLKLDRHPHFDWAFGGALKLYPGMRVQNSPYPEYLISRRPLYGFHCVLQLSERYFHSVQISCFANIMFLKLGFDFQLNPICIISDHTYLDKEVPNGFEDIGLLYTDKKDVGTKTFWECTGLEETGWITPNTLEFPDPTLKNKHGVWALKGRHDSDCEYTLAGDTTDKGWNVEIQRTWDDDMRLVFRIVLDAGPWYRAKIKFPSRASVG